ncbi:MAG: MoaD/ThiS family protein [Planctomycetia bacterium]|nr:MoaD/ThiS family protein [Planctomycetia bacterium]
MPTVWIPSLLRDLTGGHSTVTAKGHTVRELIDFLERDYPGFRQRVCDAHGLRPGLAVVVDAEVARLGLLQPVNEQSEVHFQPAIGGGSSILRPIGAVRTADPTKLW